MDNNLNPVPQQPISEQPSPQEPIAKQSLSDIQPPETGIPDAGKWEFLFAGAIALCSILICNFILYGGFHLGFAIAAGMLILVSAAYLKVTGHRFDWYSGSLLVLSLFIAAGFGRSNDGFVKFVMLMFLLTAVNLSLCLAAKQNRRSPSGLSSLLDAPRALFVLGIGGMGASSKGLVRGLKNCGTAGRKTGAVALGLLISLPILIIMVPLLMDADAAFEGLLNLLPEVELGEYFHSALWGVFLGWILYARGVRLNRQPRPQSAKSGFGGINSLTVGTILSAVCLLYCVYLVSQLAYLAGGFSGILPEEFTMAEYARRGFFEMAWLCVINLLLICGSIALVRKDPKAPGFVRGCCLFIGIVTLFLVATASAKMFLYIGSYGLTRLRVLTEVIMLWLALTTLIVCIWLFLVKIPYMKLVVLTAMVMGAVVFWVDVDTVVASYNVNAYQSGKLETVDMDHLDSLGYSATPYIYRLIDDDDPEVNQRAREILRRSNFTVDDFREWNWDYARASAILKEFHAKEERQVYALLHELLGLESPIGSLEKFWNYQPEMTNGQQFFRLRLSNDEHEAFVAQLQEAGWEELPLHIDLRRAVFGLGATDSLFTDLERGISIPTHGYYLFTDLHPDAQNPSDPDSLLTRAYPHFWLACYDSSNRLLYFFRLDMTAEDSTV